MRMIVFSVKKLNHEPDRIRFKVVLFVKIINTFQDWLTYKL